MIVRQAALTILLLAAANAAAANPPSVIWNRQLGTTVVDQATAVDVDAAGNIYVTGRTSGSLDGPHLGGYDLFLRKYDAAGEVQWNHQFGTSADDMGWGLTIDPSGDIIIVGDTRGSFSGGGGSSDAFVAKFDAAGNHRWTEQFRNNLASQALDVCADAQGNLYVSGATYRAVGGILGTTPDGFVTKFDVDGGRGWTRQFGEIFNDLAWGVNADASGNVYVSGESQNDVFLHKYDADGNLQWDREIATTGYERGHSIAVDDLGNVFVAGNSAMDHGGVNYGRFDALLAKYDADGALKWVRQTGSTEDDAAARVATDNLGNAYIVGFSLGSVDGVAFGSRDVLVAKYDADGERVWQQPLGTAAADNGFDIAVDAVGNAYVVGDTLGAFGGPNAGSADAFLLKLSEIVEPAVSADFDGSGSVDAADLSMWQAHYGPGASADSDGDADSDGADFLSWQVQLGRPGLASIHASGVPEPSSACVAVSISLCVCILRRRECG